MGNHLCMIFRPIIHIKYIKGQLNKWSEEQYIGTASHKLLWIHSYLKCISKANYLTSV